MTFLTVRPVVIRPGRTGALIDGMLRSIALTGSPLSAANLAAVSSRRQAARCWPAQVDPAGAQVERVGRGGQVLLDHAVLAVVIMRRLDLAGRPARVQRLEQDRGAGDVRRRHRGAGDGLEVLARRAAVDGSSRGGGRRRPGSARQGR